MSTGGIVVVTALWLIANSMIVETKNIQSAVVFQFIPFVLGCANGIVLGVV